jgi:hypothetical protein
MLFETDPRNPWIAMVIWSLIFGADLALVMLASKAYARGASKHIAFGGPIGAELAAGWSPERRRRLGAKYLTQLALSCGILWLAWWVPTRWDAFDDWYWLLEKLFPFVCGAYMLVEVPVLLGHARNLLLFYHASRSLGLEGHLKHADWLVHTRAAVEFACFACVWLALFAATHATFFLGGAYKCLAMALRQGVAAQRERRATESPEHPV